MPFRRTARPRPNWRRIAGILLAVTLAGSIVYALIGFLRAPASPPAGEPYDRLKSDYLLMLTQCAAGLVVMSLPSFIQKRFSIEIPNYMFILYFLFLYCAIYLGEVRDFYYRIPKWDLILHGFSAAMLGACGFSLVSILNDTERIRLRLSPAFVALFAFCFALAAGVVWEVYEFLMDGLLGMNMQKFATEEGLQLAGRTALADTMEDLMVDAAGAGIISVAGLLSGIKQQRAAREDPADLRPPR